MNSTTTQPPAAGPVALPLSLDGNRGFIRDANGNVFCELGDVFGDAFNTGLRDRAAFIVRACNDHDRLEKLLDANVIARCDAQDLAAKLVAALEEACYRLKNPDVVVCGGINPHMVLENAKSAQQ